jgi:hypothetical protein
MGWKPLLSTEVDAAPQFEEPPQANSWIGRRIEDVTGSNRTQYPTMPEFGQVFKPQALPEENIPAMQKLAVGGGDESGTPEQVDASRRFLEQQNTVTRASITPDPNAQMDILRKAIPGLEEQRDKYGNIMLRAPGMTDFAYLNKPGVSRQDLREFGVQSAVTAPLLGPAGRATTMLGRTVAGGLGLAGSSVAQDAAAIAQGSEQGIDADRAMIAGGIGAALPVVGGAVRGVAGWTAGKVGQARNLYQNATDPAGAAMREVKGAFQRDFESGALNNADRVAQPSDRAIAAGRNQDLRAMDFGGGNVEREGRKAANFSPSAKDSLMRVIGDRFEGQTARAGNVIEGEFNLARSAQQAREGLMNQARTARAPLYNQAFQAGASGIDTPGLDQLQRSPTFLKAMGRAERTLADQNAMPGWRPWQARAQASSGQGNAGPYTLAYWDQVKRNLDDYAGEAIRRGKNNQAATITEMARRLRAELDTAVPIYRQARGTAHEFFKADNALEAGQNFANGRFNFQDAAQQVGRLNPAEKNLFAEGFADEFMKKIRAVPDRSSLLNRIMQSPMEQERVRIALGQGRFDQLESFMRLEGIMDKWRAVMGNSTTSQQASDMMKGYGVPVTGLGLSSLRHPVSAIYSAIVAGGKAAQLRINEGVADEVAKLLTSKDPDVFLQGLQMLGKNPINQAIRAFDDLLTGIQPFAIQQGVNQTQTPQPR